MTVPVRRHSLVFHVQISHRQSSCRLAGLGRLDSRWRPQLDAEWPLCHHCNDRRLMNRITTSDRISLFTVHLQSATDNIHVLYFVMKDLYGVYISHQILFIINRPMQCSIRLLSSQCSLPVVMLVYCDKTAEAHMAFTAKSYASSFRNIGLMTKFEGSPLEWECQTRVG